ncbi:cold-shock' DNA-binding domain-domain-containing protein [Catenaria anguillulae PL171]|uniref:Cold-shock' DNA-binding domain-domain-containing protein n=1 Tax=Catenaria anguillulae PL171 TaxID=765915 RepID=A0A1Y2HK10_9FUNG|nr:cold-shock' DNA-binding domain-domain-containing protein [Catenaria anguillulae PL171]
MNPNGAPPSPAPSPETWSSSTAATPNASQSHSTNPSNATGSTPSQQQASSSGRSSSGPFTPNATGPNQQQQQRSPNLAGGRHHLNRDPTSSYRPRQSRTTHYYSSGAIGSPAPVMATSPGYAPPPPPPGMMIPPGYHHHGAAPYQRLHAPLDRRTGHVKFFNSTKGFGFIIPDVALDDTQSELEVFVHHTAITSPNRSFRSLAEGEPVEFDLVQGPKGYYSQNVTGPQGAPVRGDPKVLTIPRKPLPGFYHPRQGYPHEFAAPSELIASNEHSPTTTGPGDASDPTSSSTAAIMSHHPMHAGMLPPHMASLPPGAVMYFIPVPMSNAASSGDAPQESGGTGPGGPTSPIPPSPGHAQQQFMYQPYGYPTYPMDASAAAAAGVGAAGPQSPTSPVPSIGSPSSVAPPPHPYMVPVPQGYPMPYAYMSPHMPLSPPGTSPMMTAPGSGAGAGDASLSTASSSQASTGFTPTACTAPCRRRPISTRITCPCPSRRRGAAHAASAADVETHMASLSIGGESTSGAGMPRTDSGHDFQAAGLAKGTSGGVRRASMSALAGIEVAQEAAVVLQDDYPVEQ